MIEVKDVITYIKLSDWFNWILDLQKWFALMCKLFYLQNKTDVDLLFKYKQKH